MTIGALSMLTRCRVPTIRYYEQIGLLPRPARASNGQRTYRDEDLKRLSFIKRCRDFGFPIEQVRNLTSLFEDGGRACIEVRDLAQVHLDQVRARLDAMRQLEARLAQFVASCDASCVGGTTGNCVIIGDIAASCGAPSFSSTELKRP
ncbi:MAG: MerR family transcriptional regulator [Massilia sp.]|jgi:DNA-binding transcriptional MerR regulator|nr:MerR family transcriptional regulator [Massilia sp.]MDB5949902.1 MerR family transcriptional regulator [Massilia sp.]